MTLDGGAGGSIAPSPPVEAASGATTHALDTRTRLGRAARGPWRFRLFAILVIALVLLASAVYAANDDLGGIEWTAGGVPFTARLNGLAFVDQEVGFAVGGSGAIFRTLDGGVTWADVSLVTTPTLYAVDAVAGGPAWAVGAGGIVEVSADGSTWSPQDSGITTDLLGVDFSDALHGWAVGRDGVLLRSLDGGTTWEPQPVSAEESRTLRGVAAISPSVAWAWGDRGFVVRTTDGGTTWTTCSFEPTDTSFLAGSFLSAESGVIGGSSGCILRTNDSGSTWTTQTIGTTTTVRAIALLDGNNGLVVGGEENSASGLIAWTKNGGSSWTTVPVGATGVLRAAAARDLDHAWITGDGGSILRPADAQSVVDPTLRVSARVLPDGDVAVGWYASDFSGSSSDRYRVVRRVEGSDPATLALIPYGSGPGFVDTSAPASVLITYTVGLVGDDGSARAAVDTTVTTPPRRDPFPVPTGTMTCDGCHITHETAVQSPDLTDGRRCLQCHIADLADALAGAGPGTRHDLLIGDRTATGSRILCGNCHQPHATSENTPTVDPDNPVPAGGIRHTTDRFCETCHDAALPAAAQTKRAVLPPLASDGATSTADVAASWETTSVHGAGPSVAPHLRPGMGYAKGDRLACTSCHDPHGTTNSYALVESLWSRLAPREATGLLVVSAPSGGTDFRLFCGGCHIMTAHPSIAEGGADLNAWPIDCTPCHNHVTGDL